MRDLLLEAEAYAAEKTNDVLIKAVAQAYADGYRKGYEDCKATIPVKLHAGDIVYVDLGLPSGTLWASEYVKEKGKVLYLPYCEAKRYQLPTKEQWEELVKVCRFLYETETWGDIEELKKATCIGPNGKSIIFGGEGMYKGEELIDGIAFTWLKEESDTYINKAACIRYKSKDVIEIYSGYKLPIKLVKK